MKSVKNIVLLLSFILFTNCAITESLVMNEDGSGKYLFEIDASQLMAMGGKSQFSKKDSEKESKDVDSIVSFKQMFAEKQDSISKLPKEEQERLKKLENFKMHLLVNEKSEKINYSLFTDFNSISELDNLMSPLKSLTTFGGSQDKMISDMTGTTPNTNAIQQFFYDGKIFKKKLIADKKMEFKEKENVEGDELGNQINESMEMLFAQSNFKVKYTFPKSVKKVKSDYDVMYSEDRKTIIIEVPFKDYMENVEKSNLEVEFE